MAPIEVKNPKRILCLGKANSGVITLLKELTGSAPTPRTVDPEPQQTANQSTSQQDSLDASDSAEISSISPTTTTAGLAHTLVLKTRYYNATIPVWLDEVTSSSAWLSDFLSPAAKDVVFAVGAWVVVFRLSPAGQLYESHKQAVLELLKAVKQVTEQTSEDGDMWDGTLLAVGVRGSEIDNGATVNEDEWEDECSDLGFEFIDTGASGRDEERGLRGIARVREALETNDWAGDAGVEELEETLASSGEVEGDGFVMVDKELEQEFAGLKMSMASENDDLGVEFEEDQAKGVEELQKLVLKLQATRDMSAHLPQAERKKIAAKAVHDLMKDW